jgi:hypothetical protein
VLFTSNWDPVAELEDRDVEGAAAEVVDGDLLLLLLLVEPVGQGRGGRLVDDALHLEPGDACPASFVAWRWASLK